MIARFPRRTTLLVAATCCLLVQTSALRADATGESITKATKAVLESLDTTQRAKAKFDFDSEARSGWHFIPIPVRKGLPLFEMKSDQSDLVRALLEASLSEVGYEKASAVMGLEAVLFALEDGQGRFVRDPKKYYLTVFGTPGEGRWGYSFEGHHLSLNFTLEATDVIGTTPTFFASNPAIVQEDVAGVSAGTRVLETEETLAFELLASLDEAQREQAVVSPMAPAEIRAAGEPQPPTGDPVGLAAGEMSEKQQDMLRKLIGTYAGYVRKPQASARHEAIEKAGFDKVHFAWAGPSEMGKGHYYRIQGPSFLIEFVNTQSSPDGTPANHIHSVWRDLGGDFGIPLTAR